MASVDSGVETENDSNDSSSNTPENHRSADQSVASSSSLRDSRSASENSFFSGRDPMPSTSQGASNHPSPEKSFNENVLNLTHEQASAFNARFVMSSVASAYFYSLHFFDRTPWLMKFPPSASSHNLDFLLSAATITHLNPWFATLIVIFLQTRVKIVSTMKRFVLLCISLGLLTLLANSC
jgi:hypothetical protein